ncbi:uncharacterized protein LOC128221793 [Mya arenaria]|uniref:uncharacterized protein LOC128221793 n=1 Tax=Mya arenaria TaxID=6604 RepID=UPI0022E0BD28|nr:uncharacterized protein LOC128221793 [Mya arenaria]
MTGTKVERYSEDGSFFFKWIASIEYENADFYAVCSTNTSIGTSMVSLNMKDIDGKCGALVLLSPVVRGANVELGYFPADFYIQRQTYNTRTWKKNINAIQLRNGSYEEDKISEYFYKLTVFNFDETDEGTYILECNSGGHTESVHLNMQEQPSHPILGPMSLDFKTTGCIHVYGGSDVYCITDNRTEPVQVVLLIGQDSFVLAESKVNKGSYRFHNVHQHMAGLSRRNVTCQVSYAALETPYEVHGILCNVGRQCQVNDIQTISSIFRFPVKNLLIGTGVFCGLCVVFAIGNTDTSLENDVVHITTQGVQFAVVQRQSAAQRIETQQQQNDDSLTYAELDINFLQKAHARVPTGRNDTRTEYADIEFHSTQTPAVEDPVYDKASTKI